ncbi:MAG: AAA family ATPase [Saprospiraceae bacterium]|nr:AAA family ATPase [Saprospiraceae bacterium]
MKAKSLYVAATNQHVGKTTSTLGLVSVLKQQGINIGYCKPVGQRFLDLDNMRVDKDTLLFADLLGFEIVPSWHSPVILGPGATTSFIDDPSNFHYDKDIEAAAQYLTEHHEYVIYEGTGHPGVGSIVDLSNADVAKAVDAAVIMIVEGGIGNTIDRLNVSIALFREQRIPILGVIVNKVNPEKMEKIRDYVGRKLKQMGMPLLGCLPYDERLAHPMMRSINKAVSGSVIFNIDHMEGQVEDIMAGSLIDANRLKASKNILLVVGADRLNNAIHKVDLLSQVNDLPESPLAGIVATGEGTLDEQTTNYIEKHKVPTIRTHLDTFGSVIKISRIEVKINRHTPWKIKRAIELIRENVDLDRILDSMEIRKVQAK